MPVELYPHNQKTYENMVSMFEDRNRVGIVQPTGTGKSFLYLKWIEDHPHDTFTVLSPSTEIFNQLREYAEASGAPELLDSVQMISYQALLRMGPEEIRSIHSDKMVLDEFHRTGAELWGPAVQLLLDANSKTQVLGASATPVRYLDESKDMASELFDRNLAVEMTLGEAVERNILPTPQYIPVWYDIDGKMEQYRQDIASIQNPQERRELEEKLEQMRRNLENSYGAEDIFRKYMPHDHGKYIVFCRDQAHLEEMQTKVKSWLSGVNSNVHSYVSISARDDKDLQLEAFKEDNSEDSVKLLFTIDRLNEGVHVKGIDGVIMLRPTVSPIIYLQQMGRALAVGNKNPQIFDMVNNYQSVQIPLKAGERVNVFEKEFSDSMSANNDLRPFRMFEDIKEFSSVIYQLESRLYPDRDEIWNKNYDLLQLFCEEFHRLPKDRETYQGVLIGRWLSYQRSLIKAGTLAGERIQKIRTLDTTYIDHEALTWNKNYDLLQQFCDEFKRLPKQAETYQGVRIGLWLNRQKMLIKAGKLAPDRRQRFLALDATYMDHEAFTWNKNYALLQQFCDEFKRLPKQAETYKGVRIGAWLQAQKGLIKAGKLASDRQEKIQALEDGFSSYLVSEWNKNYDLLQQFCDELHRLPKSTETYEGVRIGAWLSDQRRSIRAGTLAADRQQWIESLVGSVCSQNDFSWNKKYDLLQKFCDEFHRLPKHTETYEGVRIGVWLSDQRHSMNTGTLSSERQQKLHLIEATYRNHHDFEWEQNYYLLQKFCKNFDRLPMNTEMLEDVKIGAWLQTQKGLIKAGKLASDRQVKIQALEATFSTFFAFEWNKKYQLLQIFCNEFHRLPKSTETYEGVKIGFWLGQQKSFIKAGRLAPDRLQRLEALGVFSQTKKEQSLISSTSREHPPLSAIMASASARAGTPGGGGPGDMDGPGGR